MTTMLASDLPLPRIGRGKVRDIYAVGDDRVLLLTTDRISAFDVVMAEAIPLKGVRRADVETYLSQQLGRYVKNPVVHAKVMVRLGVLGEVEHPGFYTLFSGAVVSDALMASGGPTKDANFAGARIERDGKGLFVGNGFQDAFTRGLTIEGMGLRTGDRIVVPRRNDTERTVRIVGILLSIPIAVLGIRQLVR